MLNAKSVLEKGLNKYKKSSSTSEYKESILFMQTGLENAFRAYLLMKHDVPYGIKEELETKGAVSFYQLVKYIQEYSTLLDVGIDPALLVSLNNTRNKIAHPDGNSLTDYQIKNDAQKFYGIITKIWPGLFGERVHQSTGQARSKPQPKPSYSYTPPKPRTQSYSYNRPIKAWYRSPGCMWASFLLFAPLWAVLVLTDSDQPCLLKGIAIAYVAFLLFLICSLSFSFTDMFTMLEPISY